MSQNFTGSCTRLSDFIYDLGPNQNNEYIKTTPKIEEYEGKTYGIEVRKVINDIYIKLSAFFNPEDLTMDEQILLMHVKKKLKIRQWFNRSDTYKKATKVM